MICSHDTAALCELTFQFLAVIEHFWHRLLLSFDVSADLFGPRMSPSTVKSVPAQRQGIVSYNPQFVEYGQSGEEDVADEGDDSQLPVQSPPVDMNSHEEKDDGKQQSGRNEEQPGAVDLHGVVGVHEGGLDEPRQAQTQHVEHVRAHDVRHGHVGFPCGDKVYIIENIYSACNELVF